MKLNLIKFIEKIFRLFLPNGSHSPEQERMLISFIGVQFTSVLVALILSYFVRGVQLEKSYLCLMIYSIGAVTSILILRLGFISIAFCLGALNLSVLLLSVGLLLGRPGAVWVYFIGSSLGSHFFLSLNKRVQMFADGSIGLAFILYLVLEWMQIVPTEVTPENLSTVNHFGTINIIYAIAVALGFVGHFYGESQTYRKKIELQAETLQNQYHLISTILNNMKQAIFAIDVNQKVVVPVSRYAQDIFNKDIQGESVTDIIFQFIEDPELRSRCHSSLELVFGEDKLNWDMLAGNLPPHLKIVVGDAHKDLKISYGDLRDESGNLEKVLFVIEDTTELNRLSEELKTVTVAKNRELKIVEQVYSNEPSAVAIFLKGALRLIAELKSHCKSGSNLGSISDFGRIFHTIKGNARALGFQFISSRVHEIESELNSQDLSFVKISGYQGFPRK